MKRRDKEYYTDHEFTAKDNFHRNAKKQLRIVAAELGLAKSDYDLRSNYGGPAVSGEITLHSDSVYVQVERSCMGAEHSILIRTCKGRKDYTGDHNYFAPLAMLDKPRELAALIKRITG